MLQAAFTPVAGFIWFGPRAKIKPCCILVLVMFLFTLTIHEHVANLLTGPGSVSVDSSFVFYISHFRGLIYQTSSEETQVTLAFVIYSHPVI